MHILQDLQKKTKAVRNTLLRSLGLRARVNTGIPVQTLAKQKRLPVDRYQNGDTNILDEKATRKTSIQMKLFRFKKLYIEKLTPDTE